MYNENEYDDQCKSCNQSDTDDTTKLKKQTQKHNVKKEALGSNTKRTDK
ncbi:MAG: hypothetical protein Q8873_09635 [Bacillota bacterium]|nr:hypothetical protein [Bacillota bacterium]